MRKLSLTAAFKLRPLLLILAMASIQAFSLSNSVKRTNLKVIASFNSLIRSGKTVVRAGRVDRVDSYLKQQIK